ncbi:hypothetical protein EC01304_1249, partial [Escherichia coli 0.1304]
MSPSPPT